MVSAEEKRSVLDAPAWLPMPGCGCALCEYVREPVPWVFVAPNSGEWDQWKPAREVA